MSESFVYYVEVTSGSQEKQYMVNASKLEYIEQKLEKFLGMKGWKITKVMLIADTYEGGEVARIREHVGVVLV